MAKIISVVVGVCLAFFVGYYLGGQSVPNTNSDSTNKDQIQTITSADNLAVLKKRNAELKETLSIVKKQIQTDRIAYEDLQQSVDATQKQHQDLMQKFEQQRELLLKMREKLDQ